MVLMLMSYQASRKLGDLEACCLLDRSEPDAAVDQEGWPASHAQQVSATGGRRGKGAKVQLEPSILGNQGRCRSFELGNRLEPLGLAVD